MKKLFVVILCLAVIFISVVVVQAENAVSLWSNNVEAKNNRLFDVEIYVDCSFNLAAATFEISFDNTIMEYREVRTEISGSQVKATDLNGKVKAVFLKNEGILANSRVKLFSAKFKAVSEDVCNVGISMYDCVDNNATEIKDEVSAQIKVTVSGSTSTVIRSTDAKNKTDSQNKTGISSSIEKATDPQSAKYLSVATPKDKSKEYLIIIIVLVLIIIGLMLYSAKLKNDKEKDAPKPPENELAENEPREEYAAEKEQIEKITSQETLE